MDESSESKREAVARWAGSGGMALTGLSAGPPLVAPAGVATAMCGSAARLADASAVWGRRVVVDGPSLLGERAAITGMVRGGDTAVGGTARFVAVADGWVVINLPRSHDVASVPALIGKEIRVDDWRAVSAAMGAMSCDEMVRRGADLGMAVASTREMATPDSPMAFASGPQRTVSSRPLVIDLSSLWAGPLATSLLQEAGARVVKVESTIRPDGARSGPRAFFDLLNGRKECVSIDFSEPDDVGFLRRLMGAAALVIEASRPRAMQQLGIDAAEIVAGGTSWLSITAHGRSGDAAMRVGFGDDAAVAGGLWVPGSPPMFVADAVADPMTGLVAAAKAAEILGCRSASGESLSLSAVASSAVPSLEPDARFEVMADGRGGWKVALGDDQVLVAAPSARVAGATATACGSHDADLREEFGTSR